MASSKRVVSLAPKVEIPTLTIGLHTHNYGRKQQVVTVKFLMHAFHALSNTQ